ncbi:MAG TPA: class D sortase [Terracidiphilus sp.]|nr:class D sortase [Terracidiphilus sp.]
MSRRIFNMKRLEFILLVIGLALTGFAALTYFGGRIYSMGAVARFHSRSARQIPAGGVGRANPMQIDFGLWSPERIEHYKASLAEHFDEPLAILTVTKIHLNVPVYEGTSDLILNRGVGRIGGTAPIGGSGNIGIAGHRDGFFRGLKDVVVGDSMELETAAGTQTYVIDSISLVSPSDVSVLKSGPQPSLTLVTCFPFYFVGSAPQRYIVHASLKSETTTLNEPAKASLQATDLRAKETTQ